MSFLIRGIALLILVLFVPGVAKAATATTPVTAPDPLSDTVDETCDEDFWDVLRARAEMEANRETTQNENLIARPDSVLMLTCFDGQMKHLGYYAQRNFPGEPQESMKNWTGGYTLLGVPLPGLPYNVSPLNIFIIQFRQTVGNIDPMMTGGRVPPAGSVDFIYGGQLNHLLEILVLDNLVDGVSGLGKANDEIHLLAGACDKKYYIEDNYFNGNQLGGRGLTAMNMSHNLNPALFNGCPGMNAVWNDARCTNFQMDGTGAYRDNDRFHEFQDYVNTEAADSDYRIYKNACRRRTQSDADMYKDLACMFYTRGLPTGVVGTFPYLGLISALISGTDVPWTMKDSVPTYWKDLNDSAFLDAGDPGAVDIYVPNLQMFRTNAADCAATKPVRTGVIVYAGGGTKYYDAVCPAPGCYYDPPTSLAGTGSCVP